MTTLLTTPAARLRSIVLLLVLCAALMANVGCSQSPTDKDIVRIEMTELRDLAKRAETSPKRLLILDARSARAFQAEHIAGATNMQLYEVNMELGTKARLKAYKEMVVYGDDAGSPPGKGLTKRLMGAGYDDVRFYAGGLKEWKASGFPTKTGSPSGNPEESRSGSPPGDPAERQSTPSELPR